MSASGKNSQKEAALNLIEQWRKSGKSVQSFCRENNFSHHTFRYWLKRTTKPVHDTPAGFIPVKIKSQEKIIELRYPNQVVIRLSSDTDISLFRKLIQLF